MQRKPSEDRARPALCGATLHLPQRGPYLWEEFDAGLFADAFGRMADWGLELVRLPLIWEAFQPRPERVPAEALKLVVQVLDLAAAAGLAVLPWTMVGAWPGLAFLPPWALGPVGPGRPVYSRGRRRELPVLDLWSRPELLDAQRLLLEELAGALNGHPALWGWEVAAAPERAFGPAALQRRIAWLRRHAELLGERCSDVTVGTSLDAADLPAIGPQIAVSVDWIGILSAERPPDWSEGAWDPHVPPYLAALTRWLCARPALLHVFGSPSRPPAGQGPADRALGDLPTEEQAAQQAERLLRVLSLEDLAAVVAEAWADAGPQLLRLPPYDRDRLAGLRGLVRQNAVPKPILEAYAEWSAASAERRRERPRASEPQPGSAAADPLAGLDLPEPPRPRSSAFLLLPGHEDFERVARELQMSDAPEPPAQRPRGEAPAWADVGPDEVERDPAEQVPRLYRRYREALGS